MVWVLETKQCMVEVGALFSGTYVPEGEEEVAG